MIGVFSDLTQLLSVNLRGETMNPGMFDDDFDPGRSFRHCNLGIGSQMKEHEVIEILSNPLLQAFCIRRIRFFHGVNRFADASTLNFSEASASLIMDLNGSSFGSWRSALPHRRDLFHEPPI